MKITHHISLFAMAIMSIFMLSCSNDGDTIYTTGGDDLTLNGTSQDIVLDYNQLDALALSLYWNDNSLISTSDPRVAAPKHAVINTIQFSADESFTNTVNFIMENGVYQKQFTVEELNNAVGRIGIEGGKASPVYIRIAGQLANNMTPQYSNTLTVQVTPYVIDMTLGHYLTSSQEDTGKNLYSADSDGIYKGFIGAGAWENWYLQEGNGVIWGNDGNTGTSFMMTSSESGIDMWNYWYPGGTGCYYTIVDTPANEWSALFIPALTVSGDIQGEMVYDRKANTWTLNFTATEAKTAEITISGTGKQYNVSTGTDDSAAIDSPVGFGGTSDHLDFGTSATTISVSIPEAGEKALELNLSDPTQWTVQVVNASNTPEETVSQHLFLSGIDDGINGGNWTFDNYLVLYNEDNLNYGGVCNVNSTEGYRLYKEANNWNDYYGMVDGGTGLEGSLSDGGSTITAPDAGLYLFDVSLSGKTYHLYPVTSVSYAGLNDNWDVTAMQATAEVGVYTAQVTKSANTPYGVKVLINGSWDLAFGGGSGVLRLYQDGFDGDNDLANGTYTLTVNLCKGTYSYTANNQ